MKLFDELKNRKISEKEYRGHPALSRSELWQLSDSPEKFKYSQTHKTEPTEAMMFGSMVHKLVLEPDDLFTEYVLAPDSDRRTKAGKAEWDEFLAEAGDRIVVSNRQLRPALSMVDALKRSPLALKLLAGPHEIPFFWSDPETGLVLKCRVDGLIELDGRITIIDYKTAVSAQTERFSQEAIRYGYHFQAAFYGSGVRKDLELDYDPEFIFIVQEKKEPYSINVIKASEGFVLAGQDKMRELLGLYCECDETGVWYGYTGFFDDINETVLPGWMQLGIDEEEE